METTKRPGVIERIRELFPETFFQERPLPEGRRRGIAVALSLVVAFTLWFTFSMRETYSVTIDVPITIASLPQGSALAERPPRSVRLQVQGEGWELLKLRQRPPSIEVHVTGATVDLLQAATETGRLPIGVTVQTVLPSTLQFEMEPRITRAVPVRLNADIETAPPFDLLTEPTVSPDTVRISGARSIIQRLDSWPTAPVRQTGIRQSFSTSVPLSDTLSDLISLSLDQVRMSVVVDQFTEWTRSIPVRVENLPAGAAPVRLIPDRVQVTYRVPAGQQFERAERSANFYAYVPYAAVVADTTGTVQPLIHVPDGLAIRNVRVEPRRLRYRVIVSD
jgi:hypothetical protein